MVAAGVGLVVSVALYIIFLSVPFVPGKGPADEYAPLSGFVCGSLAVLIGAVVAGFLGEPYAKSRFLNCLFLGPGFYVLVALGITGLVVMLSSGDAQAASLFLPGIFPLCVSYLGVSRGFALRKRIWKGKNRTEQATN